MRLDRHYSMGHKPNVTSGQTGEGGFALPMTLFVTTFVTLMLASAFSRLSSARTVAGPLMARHQV